MNTRVSLVCTANHKEGVYNAVKLLGINPVRGKLVALKPNFNTADPFPASTHNDTIRTLVEVLKESGSNKIVIAERSGPADTVDVMKDKKIFEMGKELGFELLNLDEVDSKGWIHIHPDNSHWSDGFMFARIYAEAECVVQTCCLKTHRYGGHFTISLKNSVGMVKRNYMQELHKSRYQRQMIAEINTAYSPALIVMDGIEAFVTGGPMEGEKAKPGVVIAGIDRIAIDAVGVAILRSLGTTPEVSQNKIFQQDQIARAVELGLGIKSPDEIEFVAGDKISNEMAEKLSILLRS
jgi:uncharacterized protein (DUF362 family)